MELGFSLSDIGYRLRWGDIRALVLNPKPGGHIHKVLDPNGAKIYKWLTPENTLLAHLYDLIEADALSSRGQKVPQVAMMDRILQNITESANNPKTSLPKNSKKKRQATASEIRAAVAARATPAKN